jgi:secondary thiamine-phosphate synthase enzyme
MTVKTFSIPLNTKGNADITEITHDVAQVIGKSGIQDGIVTIFTPSSTSTLTTIEYEAGCLSDLRRLLDQIAPAGKDYAHHARWGDDNGHSHVRAALLKPFLTVPFVKGSMTLGTWQQIIFIDFDTRPRRRELVVQVMGE